MPPDPLRQAAQTRLATLRAELANGRDALTQLEHRRVQIADTLLRIEGAIQVLDEVLTTPEEETPLCPNPNAAECMHLPSV